MFLFPPPQFYYFPSSMFLFPPPKFYHSPSPFLNSLPFHNINLSPPPPRTFVNLFVNTSTFYRPYINPTSTANRRHIDATSTPHRPYIDPTSTLHRHYIDPTSALDSPFLNTAWSIVNIYNHHHIFPSQFFYSLLYNFIIFPLQCFYSLLYIFISDLKFRWTVP